MAAGTRTALTVDGNPRYKRLSWEWTSLVEEAPRSFSVLIDGAATNLQIEAFVAALAAMSSASLSSVVVSEVYSGIASRTNATGDGRPSLDDIIKFRARNLDVADLRYIEVASPDASQFLPNSEEVNNDLTTNTLMQAMLTAWSPIDAGYEVEAVFFSEHQETNQKKTF